MFGFKIERVQEPIQEPKPLFPNGVSFLPSATEEEYTPDFPWLERHDWVILFVYDELMINRLKYDKIGEHSFNLSKAFTKNDKFVMWKKKLGTESFVIPLEGADRVYNGPGITSRKIVQMSPEEVRPGIMARIKGELHCVRPEVFWRDLDKAYQNKVEFERQRIKVLIPYRYQSGNICVDDNEFIKEISAWMYVGKRDYWLDQLDGGVDFSTVGCFNPRIKTIDATKMGLYYHYSRLEYDTNF